MSNHRQHDDFPDGAAAAEAAALRGSDGVRKPAAAGSALQAHLAGVDERRRQIAIALHHGRRGAEMPRVVASGSGAVAEQILAAAFAAGVKVREDADLAEILAAVEVDSEIPLEALSTVAEILSYVYRANGAEPAPTGPAEG